jgi:3-oxoacyl-[acyl-carrier-protein] synthase III
MGVNAGLISLAGYLPAKIITEAQRDHLVHFLASETLLPSDAETIAGAYDLGACREISSNAERDMIEVVQKALYKAAFTIDDVDFFVTHQPVAWAAKAWRVAVGMPEYKFYEPFETYGNIATCSVPVNLLEATERDLIKAGDRVLLASSGAGENHIAVLERVTPLLVQSIRASPA